jgi:hypothetical protein
MPLCVLDDDSSHPQDSRRLLAKTSDDRDQQHRTGDDGIRLHEPNAAP